MVWMGWRGGCEVNGDRFEGRNAAVVGLGVSNMAVVRFLLRKGARVSVFDAKGAEGLGRRYEEIRDRVEWFLGPGYLDALAQHDKPFDYVFLTPGMRKDFPQLEEVRERGACIDSEMGLVFRYCPARITGITGSAGKTTTTTLAGLVLAKTGRRVHVGGNIGRPMLEALDEIGPEDIVLLEMSSFQLQLLRQSPHVAALLNIRPNHLDIHSSFEEYVDAKRNILRFQQPGDAAVLNADDPPSAGSAHFTQATVYLFSRRGEVARGAFLDGDRLILRSGPEGGVVAGRRGEIPLPGEHNVENVLAALCIGMIHGVPHGKAWDAVRAFHGVEHRLELVRRLNGVDYINDSIATTPDRAAAALLSFDRPVILIAGGYDKKIPFDSVAGLIAERVRVLILLGATAGKIKEAVEQASARSGLEPPEMVMVKGLAEAVSMAHQKARPGEVVLLSPACASYDMFANYEERGRLFKSLVASLAGRDEEGKEEGIPVGRCE